MKTAAGTRENQALSVGFSGRAHNTEDRGSQRRTRIPGALRERLRSDHGNATAEFPLVAALTAVLALTLIQLALFVHVRNSLTDIAVQSAYTAALKGNDLADGEDRAKSLVEDRFAGLLSVEVSGGEGADGVIWVNISADLPLVGLIGPAHGLSVKGHAVDEDSL